MKVGCINMIRKQSNNPNNGFLTILQDPSKLCGHALLGRFFFVSFFDSKGMIYHEFTNRTVGANLFVNILRHFIAAYQRRRPSGHVRGRLFLHFANAPVHTAKVTKNFLRQEKVQLIPHPPYSPDLAPSDFWFFPRVKHDLRGRRFQNLDLLKEAVNDQIADISSLEHKQCIMKSWIKRITTCLSVRGHYFEGFLEV